MNELAPVKQQGNIAAKATKEQVFVTIYVADQLFGIPVERVQDILVPEKIAHIPLAPPEVAGAINLRGRIVTVLNVRTQLGLGKAPDDAEPMCVTVEQGNDLYSLMVDRVGAVLSMDLSRVERNPSTLDPRWRKISSGVIQLEGELLVVFDIDTLLERTKEQPPV